MARLRRAPPKQRRPRVAVLLFTVSIVLPGIVRAQALASDAVIYRLSSLSTYEEGCFDPCLCPIWQAQRVLGTFRLRRVGSDGGFDRHQVEDVHWKVFGFDSELRVDGSGFYTVGSPDPTTVRKHRLELDLRVGDSPVEHFDSGWVIGPSLPHIAITISMNGLYCYDQVFVVDAEPVPASEIQPYALIEGSRFQRGCYDPCDCPLGPEQPLRGTFSLLPLSDDILFSDHAMVDVRWEVEGDGGFLPDGPITGAGSYRVGGEFAVQQRMEAELRVVDEPSASFDSGLVVGGAGFPEEIDVEISQNGKVCFDTVMRVRARERPAPEPGTFGQLGAGLLAIATLADRRRRHSSVQRAKAVGGSPPLLAAPGRA